MQVLFKLWNCWKYISNFLFLHFTLIDLWEISAKPVLSNLSGMRANLKQNKRLRAARFPPACRHWETRRGILACKILLLVYCYYEGEGGISSDRGRLLPSEDIPLSPSQKQEDEQLSCKMPVTGYSTMSCGKHLLMEEAFLHRKRSLAYLCFEQRHLAIARRWRCASLEPCVAHCCSKPL